MQIIGQEVAVAGAYGQLIHSRRRGQRQAVGIANNGHNKPPGVSPAPCPGNGNRHADVNVAHL